MGRLTTIFWASPFLVACWRLAEAATDQEAAGIIRRSTHDAAAQALVPGGGLGRSVGRTRFENVSSFRVCRTRQDTDRAELSSAPAWVMSAASWPVSSPKMGCAGPWTWREVLLGEIASLDETERCVGRATELRFGLPLGVLGNNAPGPRYAAGQRCRWAVVMDSPFASNAFPDPN